MSIAATFVAATLLSTGCLWTVSKWTSVAVPTADLLTIAGLCSGLALLPSVGWLLATVIMSLLIMRLTEADPWPDAVLMVVGSNVVWLLVKVIAPRFHGGGQGAT
jgi:glucose-6-phosphate-specific signal transduction histidine kinase